MDDPTDVLPSPSELPNVVRSSASAQTAEQTAASLSELRCRRARVVLTFVLVIAALAQFVIESSGDNLAAVSMVALISVLMIHLVVRASVLRVAPLPVVIVAGFNLTTLSGSLIAQTLFLSPMTYNLEEPLLTFGASAGLQMSLLVALWVLLSWSGLQVATRRIAMGVVVPLGLVRAPTPAQLWMMGAVGVAASVFFAVTKTADSVAYGDVLGKLLIGFHVFAYMPFFIPLLPAMTPNPGASRNVPFLSVRGSHLLPLVLYFGVVIGLATLRNSRSVFALAIASVLVVAALIFMLGQFRLTRAARWVVFGGVMGGVLTAPLMVDLSTAILVARQASASGNVGELADRTWDALQNPALLEEQRILREMVRLDSAIDEDYNPNPFLNRLVVTKYIDNGMALDEVRSGHHAEVMWRIFADKVLSLLPTPVLRFFGSDLDKDAMNFSGGDTMLFLQGGQDLGMQVLGSTVAYALGLAGNLAFLMVVPLALLAYFALQVLTRSENGWVIMSPVIVLKAFALVHLFSGDSLVDVISFLFRDLPQTLVLYLVLLFVTGPFVTMVNPRQPPVSGSWPHAH